MRSFPHRSRTLGVVAVLATLPFWACGKNSNPVGTDDTDEDPQPVVSLSPSSVSLSAVSGDVGPATATVSVDNVGDGTLTGLSATAMGGDDWLSAALGESTAPATLTVSASAAALSEGTYSATVVVSSSMADVVAQVVQVTFTVTEAPSASTPDLVVDGGMTLLPSTVQPTDDFFLGQFVVENQGTAPAAGFDFGVYLSTDAVVTTDDARLDGDTHPPVDAGQAQAWGKRALSLPPGTAPGSYHVGIVLDETGAVLESDEANNVVAAELTVTDPTAEPALGLLPALVAFEAMENGSNPQGQDVSVVNTGGGSLTGLTASVSYAVGQPTGWLTTTLSTTTSPSTLALDASLSSLAAGMYTAYVTVASPDAVNSPQTLGVTLDVSPSKPDLIVEGFGMTSTSVAPGSRILSTSFDIRNVGTSGASISGNGFYLSSDSTVTPSDNRIDGNTNPSIDAGESLAVAAQNLLIPESTAPGDYYLGVLVDFMDQVDESDESNNFLSVAITVTGPPSIGLSTTSVGLEAEAGDANPAVETVYVANDGGGSLTGLGVSVKYDAGQPTGWLEATLSRTNPPAEITLAAVAGALPPATYGATVTVTSPVADDSPRTIDVSFLVTPTSGGTYTLTIDQNFADAGDVTANPAGPTYLAGTVVTLTAVAATDFRFASWTGDATGAAVTTVTMDRDRSVTANFELLPPTLSASAVSDGSFTLTWEFGWPCPSFCLGSSQDRYELQESTSSPTSGFSTIGTLYGRTSPQSVELTRSPGTYYYRVRAIDAVNYGTSPYSLVRKVTVQQQQSAATTVRIINDLPGGIYGTNDWTKLNTIIRVRVGSTESAVLNLTGDAQELLYPYDQTSSVANLIAIEPGEEMTLEVPAYPSEYWLYIQTGWWDYFAPTGLWEKHMAVVLNCSQAETYKWRTIYVSQPFGHPEVIRASDFLPDGHWYGSQYC